MLAARILFACIALHALGEALRASSAWTLAAWLAVFGVAVMAAVRGGR